MEAMIEQVTAEQFDVVVIKNWLVRGHVTMKADGEMLLSFFDKYGYRVAEANLANNVYYIMHYLSETTLLSEGVSLNDVNRFLS